MNPWLMFIIGVFCGAIVGMFLMSFLIAARTADEQNDYFSGDVCPKCGAPKGYSGHE